WSILLACERLVQPVAPAAKDRIADDERHHRPEHTHGPKPADSLHDDGRRKDQRVKQLARVSGAEPVIGFQVSSEAQAGIGPDKRDERSDYQGCRVRQRHTRINTTSTLLCQVLSRGARGSGWLLP